MRYYTKEWYELMQSLDYTLGMKPIDDKPYSDADIAALYDRELKKAIRADKRDYNTPPFFLDIDDIDLDDLAFFDPESERLVRFDSEKEALEYLEADKKRAMEEFENRPPFSPQETIESFKNRYEGIIEHGDYRYPDYITEKLDMRLVALGFLPRPIFYELEGLSKQNKKKFDAMERAAVREFKKQHIPEDIAEKFDFHDAFVLKAYRDKKNYVLLLRRDFVCFDGQTPYTRVIFKDADIIECEEPLDDAFYLYDELYNSGDGYEAHMLFDNDGLKYLTLKCSGIVIVDNIDYEESA